MIYSGNYLDHKQQAIAKEFRNNVLHAAVQSDLSTAAEVSLIVGADVNAIDKKGMAPLSRAAENGHEAVVRLLADLQDVKENPNDEGTSENDHDGNMDSKNKIGSKLLLWGRK
jgi:ankyrin repeat protein